MFSGSFDKSLFTIIPSINAQATDVIVILPKLSDNPPIPEIKILEMTNKFCCDLSQSFESIFNPLTAINP